MGSVFRPSRWRSIPFVAFGVAGLLPLFVGAAVVITVAGLVVAVMGVLYGAVVLTTSLTFDGRSVKVSSLGRRKEFLEGRVRIRFYKYLSGFVGSNDAVELRDEEGHMSVALSMFRPNDRGEIRESLVDLSGPIDE